MTAPPPIPPFIDHIGLLHDLQAWGWRPYKIEAACGFSVGYVAWLQRQTSPRLSLFSAAQLHNLWCDELSRRSSSGVTSSYERSHSFGLNALSA